MFAHKVVFQNYFTLLCSRQCATRQVEQTKGKTSQISQPHSRSCEKAIDEKSVENENAKKSPGNCATRKLSFQKKTPTTRELKRNNTIVI